ncbi:hypothetical protein ACIPQH_25270 [Streptomyces rubiginosohelvolus]
MALAASWTLLPGYRLLTVWAVGCDAESNTTFPSVVTTSQRR